MSHPLSHVLKYLRKQKGWTQKQLSESSGVKREIIAQVEIGRSGFGPENAKLVADALGVNVKMLEYVKPGMAELEATMEQITIEDAEQELEMMAELKRANDLVKSGELKKYSHLFNDPPSTPVEKTKLFLTELPEEDVESYIPAYDVEVTAGKLDIILNDDVDETPSGYLYAPSYFNCVVVHIKGDSMYDRIFPGSRVFVQRSTSRKYIDYGQIYIVVLEGERLIKYVYPHPSDDTKIILRSHNVDKYPDWFVEKADVIHMHKVKGYENQNAM